MAGREATPRGGQAGQGQYEWIARRSGRLSAPDAGRAMGVCGRHVRGTRARYEREDRVPAPRRHGRRPKEHRPDVVSAVLAARRRYRAGAAAPGCTLGIPGLSHNVIHRILAGHGMVDSQGRRARRVPWIRHGRTCPSPLWHTDWTQLPGKEWLIAHGDDASRLIMGHGIFSNAAPASAVGVLRRAIREHGKPASVMTDRGTQSCAVDAESRRRGATEFEKFLASGEIRRVLSSVGHPQANGKTGRLFREARARPGTFADVGEIVAWWNTAKPHRSLDFARGETPCEALGRKMPPEGAEAVADASTGEEHRVTRGPPGTPEGGS